MIRIASILLLSISLIFAQQPIKVKQNLSEKAYIQYTSDDGLPSNWVSSVAQDNQGYLWIATQNGLSRFDGANFINLYHDPYNDNSIASNGIREIVKDNEGNLWMNTTGGGLQKLSPNTLAFSQEFTFDGSIPTNIRDMLFSENRIWLLSENGIHVSNKSLSHFKLLSPKTNFNKFYELSNNKVLLTSSELGLHVIENFNLRKIDNKNISSLIVLNDNLLFVSYNEQFYYYNLHDKSLQPILASEKKNTTILGSAGMFSYKGDIFLPTKKGFQIFNRKENSIINQDISNEASEGLTILSFFSEDKNLWIGTTSGLFLFHSYSQLYNASVDQWQQVNTQKAREIYQEGDSLWVGNPDGLELWTTNSNQPNKINKYGVLSFLKTKDNQLFIGTDGLNNRDIQFIHKNLNNGTQTVFSNLGGYKPAKLWALLEHEDKIWFTGHLVFGYYHIPSKTTKIIKQLGRYEPVRLIGLDMLIDSKGRLWLATLNGCYRINDFPNMSDVDYYSKSSNLPIEYISNLHEDSFNTIWLGGDGGLLRYNETDENFTHWGYSEGLKDMKIMDILSTTDNELWISTLSGGIYIFDYQNNSFTNLSRAFGLSSNDFLLSAGYATNEILFFGTEKDLVRFNPEKFELPNKKPINLVLNKIQIESKSQVKELEVDYAPLTLDAEYGNLILAFNEINFFNPKQTTFYYKVEGLYDAFVDNGNSSNFSFVNLPTGNYNIRVKAENPNFLTTEKVYQIKVKPPYYASIWAYIGYGILFLLALYAFIIYQRKRIKAQNQIETLKHVDEAKSKMYAEISHELKTPLMLIQGNTKQLKNNYALSKEEQSAIHSTEQNTNQILNLVNQMLDLVSIDAKKFILNYTNSDIIQILKQSMDLFESQAKLKNQNLNFVCEIEEQYMQVDTANLTKVINNLLSNAIKFTPKGGSITIRAKKKSEKVFQFSVIDTGKGIESQHLHRIFDRHYRTFDTEHNLGNGIGMALCKELVELMKGNIAVESTVGKGSIFTIQIPIIDTGEKKAGSIEAPSTLLEDLEQELLTDSANKTYHIMVVEDNKETQIYYHRLLSHKYRLSFFNNGVEALEELPKQAFDFILSDVVMPKMDGLEFCKRVKSNWKTSHIPLIFVSGKTTSVDRQTGYIIGADAYLPKPFDETELQSIITNLLRKQVQNATYYKKLIQLETAISSENELSPNELDFLKNLQDIVINPLGQLSTNELAKRLHMSRSQLHRKIKTLTNMPTTHYINHIRVEKAKDLLKTTKFNVSEIAYEVGFADSNYFTKAFKNLTGESPTSFRKD